MRQNIVHLVLAAVILVGSTACKAKQSNAEHQAAAVAAFQQRQKIEAIKSYTALVEKYPDSEFAPKAKERLNALGPLPAATPAAKK